MTDQTIATIPKNGREDIRISIRDFGGRKAVDIRVFVESGEGRKASPKGIAVKPELVRALIEGLEEAEAVSIAPADDRAKGRAT